MNIDSILGRLLQLMTLHSFPVACRVTWILGYETGYQCLSTLRQMSSRFIVFGPALIIMQGWYSANHDSPLGHVKPIRSKPHSWEWRKHSCPSKKKGKQIREGQTTDIHYRCFQSTFSIFLIQKTLDNPKIHLFLACYLTHFSE